VPHVSVTEGPSLTTVSLPGDPNTPGALDVAYAWRIRNGLTRVPDARTYLLRTYLLHSPARRLVRLIYLHDDVYPGADVHVAFRIPSPSAVESREFSPEEDAVDTVDLLAPVEQLPPRSLVNDLRESERRERSIRYTMERSGS